MEFNATFLASAASFVLFTLIMNKVLYKPLSDIVQKRQEYLDANENAAQANLKSVNNIKADKDKKIAQSRNEAKNMIFSEIENSKISKAKKEIEKKQEISAKLQEHKNQLQDEKSRLSDEISGNVEELSDTILSKLLGGEVRNG